MRGYYSISIIKKTEYFQRSYKKNNPRYWIKYIDSLYNNLFINRASGITGRHQCLAHTEKRVNAYRITGIHPA
jgi:hypothetical protein